MFALLKCLLMLSGVRFDMSRVHAVTAVGPMRWDVIDGLVVETDGEQLGLLSGDNSTRRVLVREK